MKKLFPLLLMSLLFGSASINQTMAQNLVNFNNTSDLTTLFNPSSNAVFVNISDQGLGNSGSVNTPSSDISTTKAGYTVTGSGDVYTVSTYFHNSTVLGYGCLGFTVASTNNISGSYGNPANGIGVCFHGGGVYFSNDNSYSTNNGWVPDLTVNTWYKMVLKMTNQGGNTFDLDFQVWNSDADGNIGSMFVEKTYTGVSNSGIGSAGILHAYFATKNYNSDRRFDKIDNFDITLSAGISVVYPPVLSTNAITSITSNSASCGGNVTNDNSYAVTAKGVCWNTSTAPTIADNITSDGTGTGTYSSSITGLSALTTYYTRAYATNAVGTSYGNEISFSTSCRVYIPDVNFKTALLATPGLDGNGNGEIECSEATAYTGNIVASSLGITDLTGIEAFTNITELDCHNNSLTSLNVSSNTALNNLYCGDNLLTSLNVSGLTSLLEIHCYMNQLTSFNVSSNTALMLLNCWGNLLSDLNVSGLTSLYNIDCGTNLLTSLDVSSNTALTQFFCYENLLTNLNVKNGNNTSITNFSATDNPSLTCIQVDDATWSRINWTNKDAGARFSEDCDATSWIGNTSTAWSDGTNWSTGLVPAITDNVIIPSGTPHSPIVNIDAPAVCNNLTIDASATLTIAAGQALTASGNTTNNGTFTIEANASSMGSFIDNGNVTGNVNVQRYVSTNGATGRWEYFSSPIADASSDLFASASHPLYYAIETTSSWGNYTSNANHPLEIMKGFTRKFESPAVDGTITFTGTLNTGSQSIALTGTTLTTFNGWNLVGNPYPSTIDWDLFSASNSDIEGSYYVRSNGTFGSYVSGMGTITTTNDIPPMQAFWVRVKSTQTTGTLTCNNSFRTHGAQNIYKTFFNNTLHLTIANNTNSLADDTYIRFNPDATDSFDGQYDAYKMFAADATYPQLYTNNGIDDIAINSLSDLLGERNVALGFKTTISGQFTLTSDMVSTFTANGNTVYLEDLQTGIYQDLSVNSIYQFTSAATTGLNRFVLNFNPTITSISEDAKKDVQIFGYNNQIHIKSLNILDGDVTVYDILGKVVATKHLSGSNSEVINLDTKSAVYVVKYTTNSQTITKRILINQ
jgi:hypothetical protein